MPLDLMGARRAAQVMGQQAPRPNMSMDMAGIGGGQRNPYQVDFNPMMPADSPFKPQQPTTNPKRLFSNIVPQPEPEVESGFGAEGNDFYSRLRAISENRPAQSAYRSALEDIPQAQDYNPSGWRKAGAAIAGGLTGFGSGAQAGYETATNLAEAPYRRAMSDYQARMQGLGSAAEMEAQDIEGQRGDFVSAAQYGQTNRNNRITQGFKRQELETEEMKQQSEHLYRMGQIQRLMDQTDDEGEKRILQRELQTETARHNAALEATQRIQANASMSQASAAHRRAGAEETRANKYQPPAGPDRRVKASEISEATAYKLRMMAYSGEYGDAVTIDENGDVQVGGENAKEIMREAEKRAYSMIGKTIDEDETEEDPWSPGKFRIER